MTLIEGLPIILSSIAILVTIIGLTISYQQQKRILEWQHNADTEREKSNLSLMSKLNQAETLRKWVNEGHDLIMLSGKQDATLLKQRFIDWQLNYHKEIEMTDLTDYDYRYDGETYYGDRLRGDISSFNDFVTSILEKRVNNEPIIYLTIQSRSNSSTYTVLDEDFDNEDPNKLLVPDYFWDIYSDLQFWLDNFKKVLLIPQKILN